MNARQAGHLAEKLSAPHDDVEWEEGDHGGFDIPTLVIFFSAVAIAAVGFLLAGELL